MPTTFPKCSVQFFAATSADPDERVTHDARANTHVPLPLPSLSFSLSLACKTQPVHVYDASVQGVCRESIAWGVRMLENEGEISIRNLLEDVEKGQVFDESMGKNMNYVRSEGKDYAFR